LNSHAERLRQAGIMHYAEGRLHPNLVPAKGIVAFFKREPVNVRLTLDQPKAGRRCGSGPAYRQPLIEA
jgi:hypothetical protein